MPTRCNRGFYCRSYCLFNMFRAPLCPLSGAQEYRRVFAACGISCCGFQVAGLVWSWGLCVRSAGCCSQKFNVFYVVYIHIYIYITYKWGCGWRVGCPWPKYSLPCKPHTTYLTKQCSGPLYGKRHFRVRDLPAPGYTNCSVPVFLRRPATSLEAGNQSRCSRSGVSSRFLQHAEHSCFKTSSCLWLWQVYLLLGSQKLRKYCTSNIVNAVWLTE